MTSLLPDEELSPKSWMNLTPMVDFLFLVIAVFAVLALTRTSLFDIDIDLAKTEHLSEENISDLHVVHLAVTKQGDYRWMTEFAEYAMKTPQSILFELSKQGELGFLPSDTAHTKILLHIDKHAEWEPILQLVSSLKKAGYSVHPLHEETK